MIAKIIAHGETREAALNTLAKALGETIVAGPRCNVAFLKALALAPEFRAGNFDTGFIAGNLAALAPSPGVDHAAIALGAATLVAMRDARVYHQLTGADGEAFTNNPWDIRDAFQLSGERRTVEHVIADGERYRAEITWPDHWPAASVASARAHVHAQFPHWVCEDRDLVAVDADGEALVLREGRQISVRLLETLRDPVEAGNHGGGAVRSPMHGKLVSLGVALGEAVKKGQRLAIVEAMKMEHALVAPFDGRVTQVSGSAGAQVAQGAMIVTIERDQGDRT